MTMTRPLRTALIGFGLAGKVFHAPFLAADPRFELTDIVTADAVRSADAQTRYPDARIHATTDALFGSGAGDGAIDVKLVVIASPPATHYALALEAIDQGIAVVVDKPFATSSREAAALIARAEERGVPLTVFQNRRWDGDFLTLKALIDEGALGEVHRFESRFEWFKPQGARAWKAEATVDEGGGILFDLGTHLIDQAIRLFGPVQDARGELFTRHPSAAADDDAFVALTHASGVTSHLWMNSLAAQKGARFHVLGSRSAYTKWGLDGQEEALKNGARPADPEFGVEPEQTWGVLGVDGETVRVPTKRGDYAGFYGQLAEALRPGDPTNGDGAAPGARPPLPVDPRDALTVIELIERVRA